MHINQLRELINQMEAKGLTEFRCLDEYTQTSENVVVKEVLIDVNGKIVNQERIDCVDLEPYNPKDYQEVYDNDEYTRQQYATFKDFYQFMEGERLKEVWLIKNAKPVVLIGAEYLPMT